LPAHRDVAVVKCASRGNQQPRGSQCCRNAWPCCKQCIKLKLWYHLRTSNSLRVYISSQIKCSTFALS
jgi:hypothetical protein